MWGLNVMSCRWLCSVSMPILCEFLSYMVDSRTTGERLVNVCARAANVSLAAQNTSYYLTFAARLTCTILCRCRRRRRSLNFAVVFVVAVDAVRSVRFGFCARRV